MCTVLALSAVALGTQVVGGIVSAAGASQKGESEYRYYRHLALGAIKKAGRVMETAKTEIGLIKTAASRETTALRNRLKQIQAMQKTGFAASGIGGGSVTEMDVALDALEREQADEELIKYNSNVAAWESHNYATISAQELMEQAEGYKQAARSARQAARTDIMSTVLGTAANVAGAGAQMSYYGAGR